MFIPWGENVHSMNSGRAAKRNLTKFQSTKSNIFPPLSLAFSSLSWYNGTENN
jgi:hypothetical protein